MASGKEKNPIAFHRSPFKSRHKNTSTKGLFAGNVGVDLTITEVKPKLKPVVGGSSFEG